jgi:hypothetical protein
MLRNICKVTMKEAILCGNHSSHMLSLIPCKARGQFLAASTYANQSLCHMLYPIHSSNVVLRPYVQLQKLGSYIPNPSKAMLPFLVLQYLFRSHLAVLIILAAPPTLPGPLLASPTRHPTCGPKSTLGPSANSHLHHCLHL